MQDMHTMDRAQGSVRHVDGLVHLLQYLQCISNGDTAVLH